MLLQKRLMLEWGSTRVRAALKRRGVRRGARVVCHSSGWVRLEPFEVLGPDAGDVLVRTALTAVSPGTERAMYNRLPNTQVAYPFTPGYSAVGTVLEVGAGVDTVRPGDRVACQAPHASLAVVRKDRCVRVPPEVDDGEAAFVTLGVIALQGARKAGLRWGDRVAVLGRGVLGILAARVARLAGPSGVAILGRSSESENREKDPASGGRERSAGGRFDVILDVTGNPEAVSDAVSLLSPGGRIVLLGSSRGASPAIDAPDADFIEIRGAHAQMRPERESVSGRWTFLDEARLFLDCLADGSLVPFDRPAEVVDPHEAWRFYRRLGKNDPPVGAAVFDWGRLPQEARSGSSTLHAPRHVFRQDPEGDRAKARIPRLSGGGRPPSPRGATVRRSRAEDGRRLGLAFVGCGEVALRNARAAAESGVAEIRWAIDTHIGLARDLVKRRGGRASQDLSAALEDREVDAVFICAPHHLHEPLSLQAIAANKHVLVEKPLARDAREAGALIQAARSAGVLLSTCYPMRFLPQVQAARSLIQQGGLGRILGARIAEHLYREMPYWFGGSTGRSRSSWRTQRETSGGGVLLMNLCHHVDVLFHVTGLRPRRVFCEMDRFTAPGDVEDEAALTVRMTEGAIASFDASTCAPGGGERAFQVWGTEGQVALDEPPRFLSLRKTSLGATNDWARLPVGDEQQARRDLLRAFAASVLGGSPNPVPPEEALAVQVLIDAAYESAARGEPLSLSPLPDQPADVASNR